MYVNPPTITRSVHVGEQRRVLRVMSYFAGVQVEVQVPLGTLQVWHPITTMADTKRLESELYLAHLIEQADREVHREARKEATSGTEHHR